MEWAAPDAQAVGGLAGSFMPYSCSKAHHEVSLVLQNVRWASKWAAPDAQAVGGACVRLRGLLAHLRSYLGPQRGH